MRDSVGFRRSESMFDSANQPLFIHATCEISCTEGSQGMNSTDDMLVPDLECLLFYVTFQSLPEFFFCPGMHSVLLC